MSPPICHVLRLGLVDYEPAWKLQDALAAQIAAGKHPPALLLLEHPHTYTFGRRGQSKNLLWSEVELASRKVSVHWVDRGGDVTYHGPGQLVGYPLIPLSTAGLQVNPTDGSTRLPQADYVGYVRKLEEVLIQALDSLGVSAGSLPGLTGVWVVRPPHGSKLAAPPAKVAAIGVKVDARGVTRHGFALNVNPDMTYWQGIIGCGLEGTAVTSLAEILPDPPEMDQVIQQVAQAFSRVFGYQLIWQDRQNTPP